MECLCSSLLVWVACSTKNMYNMLHYTHWPLTAWFVSRVNRACLIIIYYASTVYLVNVFQLELERDDFAAQVFHVFVFQPSRQAKALGVLV